MPVDAGRSRHGPVSQREQYAKGGVGRRYWDWRDEKIIAATGAGRRILDAGCGEGLLLEKLMRRFPDRDVRGVDVSLENVRICTEHRLPAQEGDISSLPFEADSFDVVFFIEVVEHLEDPQRAFGELNRVLRQGGRLVVLFPNDVAFMVARILMLMFKEARYDPGHLRQWTPRAMRGILESADFRVRSEKSLPLNFFPCSLHHLVVAEKRGDIPGGRNSTDGGPRRGHSLK